MFNLILALQIIVAIAMVGLILIQHGKGADAGASFGAGASGTVFGAAGSANFLTRATAVLTAIFFATSIALAIQAKQQASDQLRLDDTPISSTKSIEIEESSVKTDKESLSHADSVEDKTEQANKSVTNSESE